MHVVPVTSPVGVLAVSTSACLASGQSQYGHGRMVDGADAGSGDAAEEETSGLNMCASAVKLGIYNI